MRKSKTILFSIKDSETLLIMGIYALMTTARHVLYWNYSGFNFRGEGIQHTEKGGARRRRCF